MNSNGSVIIDSRSPTGKYLNSKQTNECSKFKNNKSKFSINESGQVKNAKQEESNKNTTSSKTELDLDEMKKFLKEFCKEFDEKFELLEQLKSGSAGSVYRGQLRNSKGNSRPIAFKFLLDLKEIREKKTKEKKYDKNKHAEISIHGALKYKNIPEVYGYYKIQEYSCIAMDYSKYGDIENFKRKVLKRSSLSETFVCYIAGGILEALYYLHVNNKIIHMDIKQQNILIDDFLTIKLTDYSVSINYKKAKDTITLPMVGTCYYMSPEVLNKKTISVCDASKIDIYSLGVLLYLLAFYDYPYNLSEVNNKDFAKIAKYVEEHELTFPDDTGHSKLFKQFLKNCLNKDIKNRYNIFQAINDPWYKAYKIVLDEKEKLYNASKFVIDLMVDNLVPFNVYIKQQEELLEKKEL